MPGEQDDFDSWSDEGPRGSRLRSRWRRLGIAAAVIVIGGFGAITWYAYDLGRRSGSAGVAPLIVADGKPNKVRPDEPGGKVIPDQDKLIYQRPRGGPSPSEAERLLPPPETPLPRPQAPVASAPAPAPVPAVPASPPVAMPVSPPPPSPGPVVLAPPPSPPVETPSKTEAPPARVAEPPSRALPAPPGSVPAPKAVIAPAAPTPSQGRQAAEVRPAAGGAYKVQIAATRSDADARATWTRLQSANRDLLGSLALTVQQADLGERGIYYRIQAGGLADVQSAQSLCAALKSRRVDCMVVRP
jgi:hypothetical protein